MTSRRILAAASFLLLASCHHGSSRRLAASGYDQTCARSGDCTAVFEGDVAACCPGCPNAAINADDRPAYESDVAARAPCESGACASPLAGCAGGTVTCPHGTCEFHPAGLATADAAGAPSVAGGDYGRACTGVADCVAVYEGQLGCCSQGCPNTAIRADALAQYMSDVEHRAPICVPVAPCVPPPQCPDRRVTCEGGACGLAAAP